VPRWIVIAVLVLCVAYGVGWMSDAVLNDDPCISAYGRETDRYDYVDRWFPARTDCRITAPSGASRIESGSSEVFLAMFARRRIPCDLHRLTTAAASRHGKPQRPAEEMGTPAAWRPNA
jgi:hypothetical protein